MAVLHNNANRDFMHNHMSISPTSSHYLADHAELFLNLFVTVLPVSIYQAVHIHMLSHVLFAVYVLVTGMEKDIHVVTKGRASLGQGRALHPVKTG
jgi:hypothetical protein